MNLTQMLPPLTHEEYEDLKADIARRGVQVAIVFNDAGDVIDGHHRLQICEELGIDEYPSTVASGLSHDEQTELALVLNTHRRQLDREQRRELVGRLRSEGWSTRRIANATGMGVATIHRDLSAVPNGTSETVTGSDGKQYPASRPSNSSMPSLSTDPEFAPERKSQPKPPVDIRREQARREVEQQNRIFEVVGDAVDGSMDRIDAARVLKNFNSARQHANDKLLTISPSRIGDVADSTEVEITNAFIKRTRAWLDQLDREINRQYRVIEGGRS